MRIKSSNPYFHITYWIFVLLILTIVFGRSWGNNMAAFYFISMLFPIVIGTSYFFNYVLVPKFYMKKRLFWFGLYTFYTVVVSLYLESIVLMFSFIYLGQFKFENLGPNASDTLLLAFVLYALVFLGSFFLLIRQVKEKQQEIQALLDEKEKLKKSFLEIISNRKMVKIPYDQIIYIESLADFIKIHATSETIISKEKISNLDARLPETFLRIHRSFIINTDKVKNYAYNEVLIADIPLNIGRSYRNAVKEFLKK